MKNKGFTLIELAIVLLVIGILVGIVLRNIGSQGIQARDTRRVADSRNVSIYLAQYMSKNGSFPTQADTDWSAADSTLLKALKDSGVTEALPVAVGGAKYQYYPCSDISGTATKIANHYVLKVVLEETQAQNARIYDGSSNAAATPWNCVVTNGGDITSAAALTTNISCAIANKEYCLMQ